MSDDRKPRNSDEAVDFGEVVENLVDGVYITDGEGRTLYINPAYSKHTGIAPEELIGRTVMEICEEGILFKKSVAADVLRTKRSVTGMGFMRVHNGRSVHSYATGVPLFDEDGNVRRVVVNVFDTEKLKNRFNEFVASMREQDAIQILDHLGDESVNPMIGSSPLIRAIRHTIIRAAPTDVTVLITGESGVGKEVVADRIYSMSLRVGKPYVKVNCTSLPANLLESELFGYEKGAFTGASVGGKVGLFELANGGTILLDEIGDMPLELQTKLLRVLQSKEIMRVGGVKPISLDVRIIAATNANLRKMIQEGKFREDLYYRLSVVPIYVPPLRERKGDIDGIAKYFFNEYCRKHDRLLELPESVMEAFFAYDWPGNIREMQNVIEYLVVCSDDGELDLKLLQEIINLDAERPDVSRGLVTAVEEFEKRLIEEAIRDTGGVRRAAASLRVDPSTISRKARKYNINIDGLKTE